MGANLAARAAVHPWGNPIALNNRGDALGSMYASYNGQNLQRGVLGRHVGK